MRYLLFFCASAAFAQSCSSIPVGFNLAANAGRLNGFVPFAASSYWHRNISAMTPDSNSDNYIAEIDGEDPGYVGPGRSYTFAYPATQNHPSMNQIDGVFFHVVPGSQRRI